MVIKPLNFLPKKKKSSLNHRATTKSNGKGRMSIVPLDNFLGKKYMDSKEKKSSFDHLSAQRIKAELPHFVKLK